MVDIEHRGNELGLDLREGFRLEQGYVEHVVLRENLRRNAELSSIKANGRYAAALAVPAVMHLNRRRVDVLAAHRYAACETGDAASALFLGVRRGVAPSLGHPSPAFDYLVSGIGHIGLISLMRSPDG